MRLQEADREMNALIRRERELAREIGRAVVAGQPVDALRTERQGVRNRLEDLGAALPLLEATDRAGSRT